MQCATSKNVNFMTGFEIVRKCVTQGWEKFKRSIHVRRNHTQTWLIRSPKWLIAVHTGSEKKRKNMGLEDRLGTFANASKFTVGFFLLGRGLPKTTNFRTNFGK